METSGSIASEFSEKRMTKNFLAINKITLRFYHGILQFARLSEQTSEVYLFSKKKKFWSTRTAQQYNSDILFRKSNIPDHYGDI